ncbi:hypothetical protein JHK87_046656 [Glycine soja]|nr:hypothetical protein JHK87_046656 [Glycine soja]
MFVKFNPNMYIYCVHILLIISNQFKSSQQISPANKINMSLTVMTNAEQPTNQARHLHRIIVSI